MIIYSSIFIISHTLTNIIYNYKLSELEKKLKITQQQMNDYHYRYTKLKITTNN